MVDIFLYLKYNHLTSGSLVLTSLYEPLGSRMYEIFWSLAEGGMNFKMKEFNLQLSSNSFLMSGYSYFWEPIFLAGDSSTFYWGGATFVYCLGWGASIFGCYTFGVASGFCTFS